MFTDFEEIEFQINLFPSKFISTLFCRYVAKLCLKRFKALKLHDIIQCLIEQGLCCIVIVS